MPERLAGLPMYDWPEVTDALDDLWGHVARACRARGVGVPDTLTRTDHVVTLWRDPSMILGQVCSLNPVRDGLGETEVIGTIAYDPPPGLPQPEPGSYYSVLVARRDDERLADLDVANRDGFGLGPGRPSHEMKRFAGATVAANGTDSQSGYWSLGHFVRDLVADGPIFGRVVFTGAHRNSVIAVSDGSADLAAIDIHSWRLACQHESAAVARLTVVGVTDPTPGVVCVVSWELADVRNTLDAALDDAVSTFVGTPSASRLHISGYRRRSLDEFQIVADRVDAAARHPWHR